MLYFGTVVTAFGVAVMQPSLPPLVRAWVPQRIGFATAVYTNGLLIGEILPAALTIPLVLPMLRQSWQWDFVLWAVPVAVIAAIVFGLAPRAPAVAPTAASRRWMPDFRNPMIWRIGLLLGSVNATYFSMNGFLPDYLTHTGRPELINAALTALNLGQLPASFLLLASADRMVRTVWSYLVCGLMCLISVLAIVLLGGVWVVVACAVWGCFGAAVPGAGPGAAAADQPARGRPSRRLRHVHHQLFLRGGRADHQRRAVGRLRLDAGAIHSDRRLHARADRPCTHHRAAREKRGIGIPDGR